jgi:hypothetical protein
MLINFTHEIKQLDGKSIPGLGGKEKTTLKDVAVDALLAQFQDEQNLSGEEKCKRYVLATRIYGNDEIELTVEEVALIKKLIGRGFSPLVVGQAYSMLEGK